MLCSDILLNILFGFAGEVQVLKSEELSLPYFYSRFSKAVLIVEVGIEH